MVKPNMLKGQGEAVSRRAALKAGLGFAGAAALLESSSTLRSEPAATAGGRSETYAHIRGFNYQPSWDFSGHVIWRQFRPELFDLELSQGKRYFPGINTVRLWLSFAAFIGGGIENQNRVAANFDTALQIADKHGLKVIPTLFNGWHSVPDFGGVAQEMVKNWMDDRYPTIPPNVFVPYLEKFVGAHANDHRILIWDLCNEPFDSGVTPDLLNWLKFLYRKCKELKASAPIGVGTPPSMEQLRLLLPVSDVLTIHPYGNQKFLDAAVNLGQKTGKPVLATECCWGSLDDSKRAKRIEKELSALQKAGIGFLAHVLHHSLVADCHRQQYGPVSVAGYMAFIEADGSLRPYHDVFNKFV
ncbi:MAG TPA: cellulase family glycosylhydrolase [Terriglobia bacterium]|nr:cellulase family glycosylhydrolase [Terriglobia bacterium]